MSLMTSSIGSLSISFAIFTLNIIVVLCTLNSVTSLMNFSFSLNFLNTFPWWYAMHTIFFFFVRIISSYYFITLVASLDFPILLAFLFNSSVSILSSLIKESISCCLIWSLLNLLIFLALSELFFNYKQKNNDETANLNHPVQRKNAMSNLILRLY